jgi:hypothetical protein
VSVGKVLAANGGDTLNVAAFAYRIRRIVEAHPEVKKRDFVTDNLNINLSETLVRYVAEESDITRI